MNGGGKDFLGKVLSKSKGEKKLQLDKEAMDLDAVERFMTQGGENAQKLVAGLKTMRSGLDAVRDSGLTAEALVVLVMGKCPLYTTAGGRRQMPDRPVVEAVLEGLFALDEYLA